MLYTMFKVVVSGLHFYNEFIIHKFDLISTCKQTGRGYAYQITSTQSWPNAVRAYHTTTAYMYPRGGRLRGSWDANYPCPPPPPPLGAFGQQLVAKGVTLRRPWVPKAPDAT